jgi:hypothetical protein
MYPLKCTNTLSQGSRSKEYNYYIERPAEAVRTELDFDAWSCPGAPRILFADRYAFNLGAAKFDRLQYSLSLKKDLFNK